MNYTDSVINYIICCEFHELMCNYYDGFVLTKIYLVSKYKCYRKQLTAGKGDNLHDNVSLNLVSILLQIMSNVILLIEVN